MVPYPAMTIFLVRHGETEWNRDGRLQGRLDSPLTALGIAQAEAIGRRLARLVETNGAAIVASPLERAFRTASIIAEHLGRAVPPSIDARLREVSLGSWDGHDRAEIRRLVPEAFAGGDHGEWYFRSPDGETYEAFAGRVGEWLGEVGEAPVIAVCHGVVSRVMRGLYAGLPRAAALALTVPQDRIFRLDGGRIEEIHA